MTSIREQTTRCLFVLLLAGCSGDTGDDLERAHDLGALLPAAEVVSEPRAITFTSPEDRRYLRSGWSRFERDPRKGRGFAWGLGEASTVDFHLFATRDLDLRLEGRPFKAPDAPPQVVTVLVNDSPAGEVQLRPRLDVYDLRVPRELLRAGANRLELAYRWSRSPRQVSGAGDRRSLAVAWYGIGFSGDATGGPAVAGDPQRMIVPAGSEVAYFLELVPGSRLRLDGWAWQDSASEATSLRAPGRIEITLEAEGEDAATLAVLEASGDRTHVPLPGERKRLVRLALRVLAPSGAEPTGGVELLAPAVWAPRVPQETPPDSLPVGRVIADERPSAGRPNIVLYLIDTLRADRLGCYDPQTERRPRSTSPRIDAFAGEAVLFERVTAQSSWTRASMASVFTGKWPPAHGTNGRDDRLRTDQGVLPERLRAAGYRTAAFVTNPNLGPVFGFDRGFDDFVYLPEDIGSDGVHRVVADWLEENAGQAPFFLWVHTVDPHAPYVAPEPFSGRLAPGVDDEVGRRSLAILDDLQAGRRQLDAGILGQLEALYDATVAYNDHSFGELLDALEGRGLLDEAAVVLLSDHGDEFHEHGNWQHGRALHAESIDVPLIVKLPISSGGAQAGHRVAQRVQHVDLLPTVLDLLALPHEPEAEGRSLLPLIAGSDTDPSPPAFSYLHLDGPARVSVAAGGWKLIQRFEHGRLTHPRLYHVAEDPGETVELAERFPIRAGYLASLIRGKLASGRTEAEAAAVDEQTRKALEALGYL